MDARDFAIAAHGDQRYGAHPYVKHLDEVAELVLRHGVEIVPVAYLHDVLEDTATTAEDVEREFGPWTRAQVEALTDPPGKDRAERKRALHARLAPMQDGMFPALLVKAADRLANVRASRVDNPRLYALYRAEHAEFRAAVYRPRLCEEIWEELDRLLLEGAR